MATPDPTEVAPWYLRNINQALALDETTGNVYVRTGFEGNIIISGNVNIPGNVDAHISEIGTSGNLQVPWMPVSVDGNSNVTISGGNVNAAVTGTVAISTISGNVPGITGNVTVVDGGGSLTVDGNVGITGNVNIGTMPNVNAAITGTANVNIVNTSLVPVPVVIQQDTPTFYQFNNFGVNSNRGWTFSNTSIPMFAIRIKPGSGVTARMGEYELGNNNANQSTIGYVWYENPTITGPAWSWVDLGTSGIQYAIFNDNYNSNTPNGITGGTSRHSGIIIGKNSATETEMSEIPLTDGGAVLVIACQRLDSATKIDLWFAVTMEI